MHCKTIQVNNGFKTSQPHPKQTLWDNLTRCTVEWLGCTRAHTHPQFCCKSPKQILKPEMWSSQINLISVCCHCFQQWRCWNKVYEGRKPFMAHVSDELMQLKQEGKWKDAEGEFASSSEPNQSRSVWAPGRHKFQYLLDLLKYLGCVKVFSAGVNSNLNLHFLHLSRNVPFVR